MAALVGHDTVIETEISRVDTEKRADARRSHASMMRSTASTSTKIHALPICLRVAGLKSRKSNRGSSEIALEAVRYRPRRVIRESADLVYHLVVLWRDCGIAPDEVWAEMRRRADKLCIAEKLPKEAPGRRSGSGSEGGRMSSVTELAVSRHPSAVLDDAHIVQINGALGTIRQGDLAPRHSWAAKLKTLLAILGPGLIVMVGDNYAGAFSTYSQAGQDYGTTLLWTLALLIPCLLYTSPSPRD